LVLAAFDRKRNLVHLGNVGTGFSDRDLERMMKILRKLETKNKAIPGEVWAPTTIRWVKPALVAEIGYMSVTRDKKLRFPRFLRIRPDGNPSECTI
jgi:bifunctional non-homologous end joining protein LigD